MQADRRHIPTKPEAPAVRLFYRADEQNKGTGTAAVADRLQTQALKQVEKARQSRLKGREKRSFGAQCAAMSRSILPMRKKGSVTRSTGSKLRTTQSCFLRSLMALTVVVRNADGVTSASKGILSGRQMLT